MQWVWVGPLDRRDQIGVAAVKCCLAVAFGRRALYRNRSDTVTESHAGTLPTLTLPADDSDPPPPPPPSAAGVRIHGPGGRPGR